MTFRLPIAVALLVSTEPLAARSVSFRNDVMAVLSRGGCNAGTCHGNQNGKNGFKLSLRGEDPEADYSALTREAGGRRLGLVAPEASLLLRKATAETPHEGGRRFTTFSDEYVLLARWIVQGARLDPADAPVLKSLVVAPVERIVYEPESTVPLKVEATFSDGSVRDVSRLAVYEASSDIASVDARAVVRARISGDVTILVRYLDRQRPVRLTFVPARPGFKWKGPDEVNFIDRLVFARLRKLRLNPSEVCSDSVFMRRVFLDVLGVLPTADEARAFLADKRADRRERLVDAVLNRPEFADAWALRWSDLLRNEEKALDARGVQVYHDWIRRSFAEGKPLNVFASELIAARGSTYSHPPANYYRALRDPQTRAEATAQVFLGIRIQCARCHNHPFDHWKQADHHALAAFFPRIDYRIVDNKRTDKLDKHEFVGEQVVYLNRTGEVKHPRTGETMPPRFLGEPTSIPNGEDRLALLADWVAHPDNPYFARAQANRVWMHLLGRGIVEPNDDFRAGNPPSNPELLDALAREFRDLKFDVRRLTRAILLSQVYQLGSKPNDTNRDDETEFSRGIVRRLHAEQLLDAMMHVTGVPVEFAGHPLGIRAGQLPGSRAPANRSKKPTEADLFLQTFGKPVRSLTCECERSGETNLAQGLLMIGSPLLNGMLKNKDNRFARMLEGKRTDAQILDELFLMSVCRRPTLDELRVAAEHLQRVKDRRAWLEDIAWALVNTKEFLMRS